jgi:hypothetical protein
LYVERRERKETERKQKGRERRKKSSAVASM